MMLILILLILICLLRVSIGLSLSDFYVWPSRSGWLHMPWVATRRNRYVWLSGGLALKVAIFNIKFISSSLSRRYPSLSVAK